MHQLEKYIRSELKSNVNPAKSSQMQSYMKTDQPFYGVQSALRRKIFRQAIKNYPITSRDEWKSIVFELWKGKYREEMYVALDIAERYKKYHDESSWKIFEQLLRSATNWDTVDWIAAKFIGGLVKKFRNFETQLIEWSNDEYLWIRRTSLLAHLHHKDETNTQLLSETILKLAHEEEFFIRKAIGWVLRQYSYTDPDWVIQFVEKYEDMLSILSKREALKAIRRRKYILPT